MKSAVLHSTDEVSEERILALLSALCEEFAPYHFLKSDLYKGKLRRGGNVYYKVGADGKRGMVTGKRNMEKYGLDRFPFNFETEGSFDGTRTDRGWSGDTLVELLEHLKAEILCDSERKFEQIEARPHT